MNDLIPTLDTPGKIATKLGVPLHRVTYVLNSRPHIKPTARAGTLRLFDQSTVEAIRSELAKIDSRRDSAKVSSQECFACGEPAEHFISTPWGERHACTPCKESLPQEDDDVSS